MLAVIGNSPQALLAAAYAANASGELVGCEAQGLDQDAVATFDITMPSGEQSSVNICGLSPQLVEGVHCVLVVAEARPLLGICQRWSHLMSGRPLLLAPGNFAGALRVTIQFTRSGVEAPLAAELPGFPVIGDVNGPSVSFRGIKDGLPCGLVSNSDTSVVMGAFSPYMPRMVATNHLCTSLSNTNNLIHPPIALASLSAIDNGAPLRFYREGVSHAACNLIRAIDRERRAMMQFLHVDGMTIEELLLSFYGEGGMQGDELEVMLTTFTAFEKSMAPTTLEHRYVFDDVRHGLAGLAALASLIKVPAPTLTAITQIFSAATDQDLQAGALEDARALLAARPPRDSVRP